MKRTTVFAVLFLCVFIVTALFTMTNAAPACKWRSQCLCYIYCSSDTGDPCTDPNYPYIGYNMDCQPSPFEDCVDCSHFDGTFATCCRFSN